MSTSLLFKLTAAGQAAAWNASNTGLQVAITHVHLGSAPRTTTGKETALTTPAQLSPIAAGSRVSPSQIRLSAMFSGAQTYPIHEIGLWAGEPGTSGAVLFAYYAQATPIAHKSPGVDFIFTHDMALADAVASGSVTITTDPAASAMLALLEAHQQAADPHAQYIDQQRGDVRYVQLSQASALSLPAGSLIYYAGSVAPAGYLEANGALLSRTTYAALFAAIGIIYNAGDGSTTFGLPDLRGEFIRGLDNGRGVDAGRVLGSSQSDEFRSHGHATGVSTYGVASGSGAQVADNGGASKYYNSLVNGGAETRPRNIAMNYIIKY